MSSQFSNVLALSHIGVGLSSLISPMATLKFFQLGTASDAFFIARLFGSRDFTLGTAIWTSSSKPELRRALLAANIVNGIDAISAIVCYCQGSIDGTAAVLGGVGAALLLVLGVTADAYVSR